MCSKYINDKGTMVQICNHKYGLDFCEKKETVFFQGKEIEI